MTIEEAINILKKYINYDNPYVPDFYTMEEACKVVIKALEQEPCADMVSRDAMWDVLQRLYGTEGELVEELMSLPPVLPMPKMGKWERDQFTNQPTCSECGYKVFGGQTRYCPNCGANMSEIPTGTEGRDKE